jgi:hypothetical protein
MSWQRRGRAYYFVRSAWVDGRSETRYFGRGAAGELAAHLDEQDRQRREARAESLRAEADRLELPEAAARALDAACGLMADAALTSAGFHRQNYCPWRRRRARSES